MRFIPRPEGEQSLVQRLDQAHDAALEDCRSEAYANMPKITGETASGVHTQRVGDHGGLASGLPQAGAVERGANVGPRRGPHMTGNHVIADAGRQWLTKMPVHLRSR